MSVVIQQALGQIFSHGSRKIENETREFVRNAKLDPEKVEAFQKAMTKSFALKEGDVEDGTISKAALTRFLKELRQGTSSTSELMDQVEKLGRDEFMRKPHGRLLSLIELVCGKTTNLKLGNTSVLGDGREMSDQELVDFLHEPIRFTITGIPKVAA